jgi:hypothetical protein
MMSDNDIRRWRIEDIRYLVARLVKEDPTLQVIDNLDNPRDSHLEIGWPVLAPDGTTVLRFTK